MAVNGLVMQGAINSAIPEYSGSSTGRVKHLIFCSLSDKTLLMIIDNILPDQHISIR